MSLPPTTLERFVDVALTNVRAEYPYHVVHFARGDGEIQPPRALYPAFYGSYDWHSCVHMHWTLARALALPAPEGCHARAAAHLTERLTAGALAAELRYCEARPAFERPYGWAWLLQLAAECNTLARVSALPALHAAAEALAPLASLFRERLIAWLPRVEYPVRAGTHGNSAFGLVLAARYATVVGDRELHAALAAAAERWYGADRSYPAVYEPSGDDFLSGGLCAALAMARLVPRERFSAWWATFRPDPAGLARWRTPAGVSDPTDPKIVHLAGLNLSRAWCWRELAPLLPPGESEAASAAAQEHLARSLGAATEGDYVGTHWLASFALLATTGER